MQQDRLKCEPFGYETVEWWQRRDRDAADQECDRRLWHAMDQATEAIHIAVAGRGEHRTRTEEQQALEDRVVEYVKQRRGECESSGGGQLIGAERQSKAEADEDDADVLDRVVGKKALQIMLHQ